jgi:hypothetical protein
MILTACPSVVAECTLRSVFLRNTISAAFDGWRRSWGKKQMEVPIQISNFPQIMDPEKDVLQIKPS